jgi:tyrosinase
MGEFVSPADPIFFVHHSNIDRLWNTWTTKQVAAGLPTLPTGADLAPWTNEPFAFFHDAAGRGLPDVIAGDYATIGDFDYAYTPGSGDAPPAAPIVAMADLAPVKATKLVGAFAANKAGSGTLAVAPERLTAAAQPGVSSDIYAVIEVKVPADAMRIQFAVFVNAPPNKVGALDATSPSYAGAFQLHGGHAHTPTMRFIVDLSGALEKLSAAKLLIPGKPLNVAVVPRDLDGTKRSLAGELVSVEIRSF